MKKQTGKIDLKSLNIATKILLIVLVVAVSYLIVFLIINPFLVIQPTSMMEMMNKIMRGDASSSLVNIISFIIALIIGVIVSFYLFAVKEKDKEYDIIKKVLSDDEKRILDEIKKAGAITQDSLRFRLDWSKAKVSTILTNLDKRGLIQRERIGKTYKVYLEKIK